MAQDGTTNEVDPRLVTRIVGSYVQHHKIGIDQLSGLIAEVHRTLGGLGRVALIAAARAPAVPVRRSVQRNHVVCLDCGFRGLMLRRHIRVAHGLEPTAYRVRWKLLADHPLTAPSHSARRSTLAKQLGFVRRQREAVAPPPAPAPAAPPSVAAAAELDPAVAASLSVAKRRGRPRKQPSPTA